MTLDATQWQIFVTICYSAEINLSQDTKALELSQSWLLLLSTKSKCQSAPIRTDCFSALAAAYKLSVPKSKHPQPLAGSHLVWNSSKYPLHSRPHQSDAIIHRCECKSGRLWFKGNSSFCFLMKNNKMAVTRRQSMSDGFEPRTKQQERHCSRINW